MKNLFARSVVLPHPRGRLTGITHCVSSTCVLVNDLSPSSDTWGPATDVYYRMAVSPVNGDVYGTVTNFFDFAEVQILDLNGNLIASFDAGVVPGGIAFDVRTVISVDELVDDLRVGNYITGQFDVMGRVWSERSRGMKIERLQSGELRKTWVVQ